MGVLYAKEIANPSANLNYPQAVIGILTKGGTASSQVFKSTIILTPTQWMGNVTTKFTQSIPMTVTM